MMSQQKAIGAQVMERLTAGKIDQKEAGKRLDVSVRLSRAARALGIECIHANSPQAKGRVERANQTLQDRLVKEMRLAGIDNREAANAWLPGYIADYNRRFAVRAKDPQDAHLPYQDTTEALTCTLSLQGKKSCQRTSPASIRDA